MNDGARNDRQDHRRAALLLIDVVNDLEFDGGSRLLPAALKAADAIVRTKASAAAHGIPTIYVNDNFSRWQSNFDRLIDGYLENDVRGAPIIRKLLPDARDYHVLKPHLSGFFGTPLTLLLQHLGATRLILAGLTTDRCVMTTAVDAYMRGFELAVPQDCSASIEPEHHLESLRYMTRVLKADTRPLRERALERDVE